MVMTEIKHWGIANSNNDIVYLCNQAHYANMEKIVLHINQITCKNCLKIIDKGVDKENEM